MNDIPQLAKASLGDQEVDIHYYLSREYENIADAAKCLPNLVVWLGELKGWAFERFIKAETAWKQAEAKAYFALKTNGEFKARGFGEKPTEDALRHAVALDPEVMAAAKAYATAKRKLATVEVTIEGARLKIDLIRSSETTRRAVADEPLPKHRE